MAVTALRLTLYQQLDKQIGQIRKYAEEDYPENVRKELLVVVDDFREYIPVELRAAASAKSGVYLRTYREVVSGFGNRNDLAKLTYEMLTIAEQILDAVKERTAAPSPPAPAPQPAPAVRLAEVAPATPAPEAAPQRPATPAGPGNATPAATRPSATVIPLQPSPRTAAPAADGAPAPAKPEGGGETAVVVRATDISKHFAASGFSLDKLSFELRLGEITAVVGRNGSGKSTLLRIVLGELAADSGTIEYPLLESSGRGYRAMAANIGYVAQRSPRWRGRLRENLEFIAAAYGIRGKANTERVDWLLNRFGLVEFEDHTWPQLSGGYQLRFDLARAVLHRPYLVVLDEPLANLDIVSQQDLLYDLRLMAGAMRSPATILLTSQHLYEMEAIATQIFLLHAGKGSYIGATRSLGEMRKSNYFELTTETSEEEVADILRPLNLISIRRYTTHYQFEVPRTVEREQVLAALARLPAPHSYFRDISHSSRPLMVGPDWTG
jgi:ABC-2 type transport system ATP-binding protein